MIDPLTLLAFVPAALALNLTPGADMMFCLGQGLRGGPRAALAADAGIALAILGHVTLAGLGLGAAVAALPWLFDAIRWAGVAYLLWLAVAALRAGAPAADLPAVRPARAFRQGLVVNLTNPKVILFVLAFLPQFTDPARPLLAQFLALGAVLALGGLVVNGAVGVFAGGVGRRLAGSARFQRWLGWVSASIFAGLAARLALVQKA
ncbi:LysE family translocator [Limimaricola pyoseonensis]|uniref:Threonine/homoserine/homoserine lactone efflux protein n=1 Tax=Limimaricola pyoseonensis TaxID=521013 RepID=A0A1G7JXK1_9RHOB|nr:LysE family translocator [Limimaricola pyoseonensis]SDF29545.1 Threonine/homoserine/homoserine lactone efflux protein [Limimaricola pyoseonensis]